MSDEMPKFPNQDELERELSDYLSKKYGAKIKVISPVMGAQPAQEPPEGGEDEARGVDRIRFDMKPEEMVAYLDRYVVRQEDAKAVLATKICTHYHRIRRIRAKRNRPGAEPVVGRIKNNILLVGPTGVGKTYLVKLIAAKLGVPFVKGDATKFSETGYVGADVEDLVRDLVVEAGDDIELAEHGIIYIDEVDKIAASRHLIGPDVSRAGVQRALLKPMEETEVDLRVPHDPISQLQELERFRKTGRREKRTVRTGNILFIMSGAFNGLAEIVQKRIQKQAIGFGADLRVKDDESVAVRSVRAEDLIAYGFESEFIGRLPVVAVLDRLSVDDLFQILKNPLNPVIRGKKEDFRSYDIDIRFQDEALRRLAEQAHEEKTGARGLVSVLEKALLPFELSLPGTGIAGFSVTREVVEDPRGELRRILENPDDEADRELHRRLADEDFWALMDATAEIRKPFLDAHPGIFTPKRVEMGMEHHMESSISIEGVFGEIILFYNQIREFESDFHQRRGFEIRFEDEAMNEIIDSALLEETSATDICLDISRDFDYGFRLVAEKNGRMCFLVPAGAVSNPASYLDELVRESYRREPSESRRQSI